jgi:hypothetical protein
MNFVGKLLKGIAFVPAIVHGVEALFGTKAGNEKREAALSFVSSALSLTQAVSSKEVVDAEKFKEGLGKVIDGVVQCLNASTWAKAH